MTSEAKVQRRVVLRFNGLDRAYREFYRTLRRFGYCRYDANMIMYGLLLGSGAARGRVTTEVVRDVA